MLLYILDVLKLCALDGYSNVNACIHCIKKGPHAYC